MKPFLTSTPYASSPVLVCLDLQREQVAPDAPFERSALDRCVENCRRIVRHGRAMGWRLAHVQRHDGRISALPELFRPIAGLEPRASEPVFYRDQPSAFASAAFRDFLGRLGDPRLILVGFSLPASILFTAVSGFERGLSVTLVDGALATPPMPRLNGEVLKSALLGVLGGFAEIVTAEDLIDNNGELLVQAANHP